MLGAAGALCCLAAGTAVGGWMKIQRSARLELLRSAVEMLNAMRLLLETERLSLPELLETCAEHGGSSEAAQLIRRRFRRAAQHLRQEPLSGVSAAYTAACACHPCSWEHAEERAALENLFAQLGSGTAAMREQAAAACIRRLKPLCEKAQADAEKGGRLCIQLGMLLGLMAGILFW